ncbi:MAG: fumarate hydratase [Candidatus Freyarchaeota archaeon]|nr:fumarate hydratase [Candidatus Freyrarchaeum guaymaensis]
MSALRWAENFEEAVVELLRRSVSTLPPDVKSALEAALKRESEEIARIQLEAMLENIRMAEEKRLPICQDTGILHFRVRLGSSANARTVRDVILRATAKATREIPLRPNAVDPVTGINSGDNTGLHVPWIDFEHSEDDWIEVTVLPKGGGSDNVSTIRFVPPSEGLRGVKEAVVDAVLRAGGAPCPPVVLGVGVGGGASVVMQLAKKALMRPISERNPNREIAKLELEILEAVNGTGVGPMGLGGKTTAIGVNVEVAHRHPASYPVAILFNCYVARRAKIRMYPNGEWLFC